VIAPKACELQLEAKEFLTVNVFKHMPPRVDGCPLEDSQCAACQLALAPSPSFSLVNLCEKDLLGAAASTQCLLSTVDDDEILLGLDVTASENNQNRQQTKTQSYRGYSLDQVSYCIEMCEDTFKVQCGTCSQVMSRTDYRDHIC